MKTATAIFLGYQERAYTRRDGMAAVARNVSLQVEGEGAGQMYVADDQLVDKVKGLKVGTPVELGFRLRLFRGEFQPRLSDVKPRVTG